MTAPYLILTNIQSLSPKLDDLSAAIALHNPDIFAISETWLTEYIDDVTINIPYYSLLRHDRNDGRRGGGVCAYLHYNLRYEVLSNQDSPSFIDCLTFRILSTDTLVIVLYVPPNLDASQCNQVVGFLIDFCDSSSSSNFMIIGDLNHLRTNDIELSLSVVQVVNNPTRGNAVLDKILLSKNLLPFYCDKCCTSDYTCTPSVAKVEEPIGNSDHCTVFLKPLILPDVNTCI
ncbi:MAG: endonuclease/exonuclease/phosphatase family protein, partial [Pseudomonadota bacterium]